MTPITAMSQRIYFISKPPPPSGAEETFASAMALTGQNLGNQLFMRAIEQHIQTTLSEHGWLPDPDRVAHEFDHIVIPAANWLNGRNPIVGGLAQRIAKTKLPCTIAGIGIQSNSKASQKALSGDELRFLQTVADQSELIGVRGNQTCELLHAAGIRNAITIGCPSYFLNDSNPFEFPPVANPPQRIAVNTSRTRTVDPETDRRKSAVERSLYQMVRDKPAHQFYAQTEETEIRRAYMDDTQIDDGTSADQNSFEQFTASRIEQFSSTSCRACLHIRQWITELKTCDFVVGTRLHGCLAGIAARVPTVLITIDSRTREVSDYLGMPNIDASQLSEKHIASPETLAELWEPTSMIATRPAIRERYTQFLEANGLAALL